jgi:hypothetical protein
MLVALCSINRASTPPRLLNKSSLLMLSITKHVHCRFSASPASKRDRSESSSRRVLIGDCHNYQDDTSRVRHRVPSALDPLRVSASLLCSLGILLAHVQSMPLLVDIFPDIQKCAVLLSYFRGYRQSSAQLGSDHFHSMSPIGLFPSE